MTPSQKAERTPENIQKTENIKTSTVIFIPSTRGGLLASMLKEKEDGLVRMTRFRVKIQEAGGTKLAAMSCPRIAPRAETIMVKMKYRV